MRPRVSTLVLLLVLAGSLAFSSLGMATDLSSSSVAITSSLNSADANFVFSSDQVAATVIPDQEMQVTQGRLLGGLGGLVTTVLAVVTGALEDLDIDLDLE